MRWAHLSALLSFTVALYPLGSGANVAHISERGAELPGGLLGPPVMSSKEGINAELASGLSSSRDPATAPRSGKSDPSLGSGILGEPGNPPGTSIAGRFERLDADHDGYISRSEARKDPTLNSQFSKADKNHDGKLSDAEYRDLDPP